MKQVIFSYQVSISFDIGDILNARNSLGFSWGGNFNFLLQKFHISEIVGVVFFGVSNRLNEISKCQCMLRWHGAFSCYETDNEAIEIVNL